MDKEIKRITNLIKKRNFFDAELEVRTLDKKYPYSNTYYVNTNCSI